MKNSINFNQRVNTVTQTYKNYQNYVRAGIVAVLMTCGANGMAQEVEVQNQTSTQTEDVKKSAFSVHGTVTLGTNAVSGDAAEQLSTKPTLTVFCDVSHSSGRGLRAIRLDDGRSDPNQPASRVTILNPHLTKKFGKDKEFKIDLEGKYTMIDKMPEANGFSPDIVGTWTAKNGWSFEGMYSHKFKNGATDSDAFRASVKKQINDIIKVTTQGWYETNRDNHFYGRFILEAKLKDGLWAQISIVYKDGKLVPTTAIVIPF